MRRWLTGTVVLAALLAALWAWIALRGDPSGAYELRLSGLEGDVSLARGDAVRKAEASEVLRPADRIATAEGGRAVLSVGEETEIRVGPSTSLQVTDVDRQGVSLELEGGALEATVRPSSGAVRVGSRGREIATADGEFAVGVQDDLLQVHVSRGQVALDGMSVPAARAGEQVTVVDKRGTVGSLPVELLLGVSWPTVPRTRDASITIPGQTEPGARVVFRGKFAPVEVRADEAGRFNVTLPLAEGPNGLVDVEVTDLVGRTRRQQGALPTRDTTGPSFSGNVDYREER